MDAEGRELEGKVVKCGEEALGRWRDFTEGEGRDVVERVEFVTESFAGIFDRLVLSEDVERRRKCLLKAGRASIPKVFANRG